MPRQKGPKSFLASATAEEAQPGETRSGVGESPFLRQGPPNQKCLPRLLNRLLAVEQAILRVGRGSVRRNRARARQVRLMYVIAQMHRSDPHYRINGPEVMK